jgi:hypothetical protein
VVFALQKKPELASHFILGKRDIHDKIDTRDFQIFVETALLGAFQKEVFKTMGRQQ